MKSYWFLLTHSLPQGPFLFLPLLICNLQLQRQEIWLPPTIVSLLNYQFQYIYIVVSELLTSLHEKQFDPLEYSVLAQLLVSLVLDTPHISKVTKVSPFSSQPFYWDCFTHLRYYWILLQHSTFHPGIPCSWTPKWDLKFAFVKVHSLNCKVLWVLTST